MIQEPVTLWQYIGVDPIAAIGVVIAATGLYFAFLLIIRVLGQRVLSGMSGFDLLVVIVLGAVLGRATLGPTATLGTGLIALVTLFLLEALLGQLRRQPVMERIINNRPVLLMAGPEVLEDELARCHVTDAELHSRLRQAGVHQPQEVAAVILEATGGISVLSAGTLIDPTFLRGVRSAEHMPAELLAEEG